MMSKINRIYLEKKNLENANSDLECRIQKQEQEIKRKEGLLKEKEEEIMKKDGLLKEKEKEIKRKTAEAEEKEKGKRKERRRRREAEKALKGKGKKCCLDLERVKVENQVS